MTMGDKIKQYRTAKNLTQEELGKMMNPPVNRAAINKWEKGTVENIKRSQIEQMSRIFNVSPAELMCFENVEPYPIHDSISIPVLGRVAAGIPIMAIENQIDTVNVSKELAKGGAELFGLMIKGDSMSPRIQNGDIVIVKKQDDAESGQIVIALINGEDACCKRLIKYGEGITLQSLNPEYEPLYFSKKDIAKIPVQIIGRVVELRSTF